MNSKCLCLVFLLSSSPSWADWLPLEQLLPPPASSKIHAARILSITPADLPCQTRCLSKIKYIYEGDVRVFIGLQPPDSFTIYVDEQGQPLSEQRHQKGYPPALGKR